MSYMSLGFAYVADFQWKMIGLVYLLQIYGFRKALIIGASPLNVLLYFRLLVGFFSILDGLFLKLLFYHADQILF